MTLSVLIMSVLHLSLIFSLRFPNNKSLGVLNMYCILLKAAAPYISLSLSHVINLTIIKSTPPDFKTARVTPIYKGQGSLTEPGNYHLPYLLCPVLQSN